jgi:hypothetical protein
VLNVHFSFVLVADKDAGTTNIRGIIEFDIPDGAHIGALGIRILPASRTLTRRCRPWRNSDFDL